MEMLEERKGGRGDIKEKFTLQQCIQSLWDSCKTAEFVQMIYKIIQSSFDMPESESHLEEKSFRAGMTISKNPLDEATMGS